MVLDGFRGLCNGLSERLPLLQQHFCNSPQCPLPPPSRVLQLLYHLSLGPSSPVAPYLSHLPGRCPGIPTPTIAMSLSPAELQQLQDHEVAADAEGQAYWADQFVKEVLQGLPGKEGDPFGGQQITREMLGESEMGIGGDWGPEGRSLGGKVGQGVREMGVEIGGEVTARS